MALQTQWQRRKFSFCKHCSKWDLQANQWVLSFPPVLQALGKGLNPKGRALEKRQEFWEAGDFRDSCWSLWENKTHLGTTKDKQDHQRQRIFLEDNKWGKTTCSPEMWGLLKPHHLIVRQQVLIMDLGIFKFLFPVCWYCCFQLQNGFGVSNSLPFKICLLCWHSLITLLTQTRCFMNPAWSANNEAPWRACVSAQMYGVLKYEVSGVQKFGNLKQRANSFLV